MGKWQPHRGQTDSAAATSLRWLSPPQWGQVTNFSPGT